VTKTGHQCLKWTDSAEYNETEYPDSDLGNHNFCRNPTDDPSGSWCLSSNPNNAEEYCHCPKQPADSTVPVSCCDEFKLSGAEKSLESLGSYTWDGSFENGKPLYLQIDGKMAIWSFREKIDTFWIIGPAANLAKGLFNYGHFYTINDVFCPYLEGSTWHEYIDNVWIKNKALNLTCKAVEIRECSSSAWTDSSSDSCRIYEQNGQFVKNLF